MAVLIMALRRSELTHNINFLETRLLKLSRERQRITSYMTAIGSGKVTPSGIAGLSSKYFCQALDFMNASHSAAMTDASSRATAYADIYNSLQDNSAKELYAVNHGLLEYMSTDDGTNAIDENALTEAFYEQALKEFVEEEVMPQLREIEDDIDTQKLELETERDMEKAELDAINNAISEEISSSAIKL